MIKVEHIKVINGNNNPCLFDKDIVKVFNSREELDLWRERVKKVAIKRYKKKKINIDLILRW